MHAERANQFGHWLMFRSLLNQPLAHGGSAEGVIRLRPAILRRRIFCDGKLSTLTNPRTPHAVLFRSLVSRERLLWRID